MQVFSTQRCPGFIRCDYVTTKSNEAMFLTARTKLKANIVSNESKKMLEVKKFHSIIDFIFVLYSAASWKVVFSQSNAVIVCKAARWWKP